MSKLFVLQHKVSGLYLTLSSNWIRRDGWLNNHPELTTEEITEYLNQCIAVWIENGRTLYTDDLQILPVWLERELDIATPLLTDHVLVEVDLQVK